jgi:hypothetical protein
VLSAKSVSLDSPFQDSNSDEDEKNQSTQMDEFVFVQTVMRTKKIGEESRQPEEYRVQKLRGMGSRKTTGREIESKHSLERERAELWT